MQGTRNEAPAPMPQNEGATSGGSASFPLFFSKPQVLTLDLHASARLRSDITMAFARDTNSIPLTLADIPEAAKRYPVAFTLGNAVIPVAIVGLEQQNYFVDAEGKWAEGCYIPSYVRKYPFVFMEMPDNDQLTLCVDEPALTFDSSTEGPPIYEDAQPSAFTKQALEFCAGCQEQHRLTVEFCQVLQDKELLSPQRSDIELSNGRRSALKDFQLINTEKFKALSEAEVFEWYKQGFLAQAYYIFQSQTNWRVLLDLANKNEEPVTANPKKW